MAKVLRLHKGAADTIGNWDTSVKIGTKAIDTIADPIGANDKHEITSIPSPFRMDFSSALPRQRREQRWFTLMRQREWLLRQRKMPLSPALRTRPSDTLLTIARSSLSARSDAVISTMESLWILPPTEEVRQARFGRSRKLSMTSLSLSRRSFLMIRCSSC